MWALYIAIDAMADLHLNYVMITGVFEEYVNNKIPDQQAKLCNLIKAGHDRCIAFIDV